MKSGLSHVMHKAIEWTALVMLGVDLLRFALYRVKTRLALVKEMFK